MNINPPKTAHPPIDIATLKGWMPVDAVIVDGRPGIWWMNMEGVCLAEPFFQQTVERARYENPARGERFTEFDALIQLEKMLDSVPPTGFIFHASRCGSTLVANVCRAIAGSIVLAEANVIDKLVARFITDAVEGSVKDLLYSVFLRGAVNALAQRRTGNERYLFVKFSCCSVSQLERIRRIWTRVPWLFLYRDPIETIVSNLTTPPPWLADQDRRILAGIIGSSSASVSAMSREELCARAIGSFYTMAHRLADDNCMLLNYNQLSVHATSRMFEFFRVSPSPAELDVITCGSRVYSKEASAARTFVADTDAKQRLASDRVREMAEKWALEPYCLLEQKRAELSPTAGRYTS